MSVAIRREYRLLSRIVTAAESLDFDVVKQTVEVDGDSVNGPEYTITIKARPKVRT